MKHLYLLLFTVIFSFQIYAQQAPFITTWEVTAGSLNINIPTTGTGYNYTIDFGDGTVLTNRTGSTTHNYSMPGIYTVTISGDFPRIYFENSFTPNKEKIKSVEQWGDIQWQSMNRAFIGCSNLVINAIDAPNLSQVTSMTGMFAGCSSFNQSINHWDVSNIEFMGGVFNGATSFNQPLNIWNTSNVVNMSSMFNGAISFNQPLDNWNVSNVLLMGDMFFNTPSFNQNISDWSFNSSVSLSPVSFAGFLSFSGMNTANYDALLARFVQLGLQSKSLGATGVVYCDITTRDLLINTLGWTIWGDIMDVNCNTNYPPGNFLTKWQVAANDLSISIPVTGSGYNYNIDFGDGTSLTNQTGTITHTYSQPGLYTVSITGDFPRIFFNNTGDRFKIRSVEQWGDIQWQSMNSAFRGCHYLIVNASDAPDLSQVTDMDRMFREVGNINQPIGHWNLSNVISINEMFRDATLFNQPLNTWNVSNVEHMSSLFEGAIAFNQPLDNWDVSNVKSMGGSGTGYNTSSGMFRGASSFNQPLNSWDVSNVTTMGNMFSNAVAFNQPLDNWDISSLIGTSSMHSMFNGASAFNQDLSKWNFKSNIGYSYFINNTNLDVKNYDLLLYRFVELEISSNGLVANGLEYCDEISRNWLVNNQSWNITGDSFNANCFYPGNNNHFVTKWKVEAGDLSITIPTTGTGYNYTVFFGDGNSQANVTGNATHTYSQPGLYTVNIIGDFPRIFFNNNGDKSKIQSVQQWGNIQWQSMEKAFYGCENLNFFAADAPDLSQTTDMSFMLANCSSFNSNINHWNTSGITNMESLFEGATIYNQPIESWDVSNVVNIAAMFKDAFSFNQPLNGWNTSAVTNMTEVFNNASSFSREINNWDTSNVISTLRMFKGAVVYNQYLHLWDMSNVLDMTEMFYGATNYNKDISAWNFNSSVLLNDFLSNSNLSIVNYDNLLSKFVTLNLQGKTLGALGLHYCNETSRDELINNLNWNITGDILHTDCTFINAFITQWTTSSGGLSITIPTIGGGYNYTVDFGDGTILTNVTGDVTHTYTQQFGVKTVKITGDFPRFHLFGLPQAERQKFIGVSQWGNIQWQSMSYAFAGKGVSISATDAPDLSQVTDMSYMFFNSSSFNSNINHWNVSNVQNMEYMFYNNNSYNQPLNNWDVSSVENMSHMFFQATSFNQPINNWDVSNVTNMSYMFRGSFQDGSLFNQPISNWDVSSVIDMEGMFRDAISFNQPLNNWDVSNVTHMGGMFRDAIAFNQPLNSWNVSNVTNMSEMFYFEWGPIFGTGYAFNQSLDNWDVSSVTDMSAMFYGAGNFNQPLNNWDVSNVTDMNNMFFGTESFNQPIDNWDVSSVTNMSFMFAWSDVFNQPLNNWDVSNITDMNHMFWDAPFNEPINNWDVSSVTDMNRMFASSSYNHPLNSWDVSNVTSMIDMFESTPFNQPLDSWEVDNVLYMVGMFGGASSFNQDLSDWDFNPNVYLSFSGFRGFVQNSGLDVANYDALLARFVQLGLQNKLLTSNGLYYCDETSHNYLTNILGWNITGDTLAGGCNMYDSPFVTTWEVTASDLSITVPASFGSAYGVDFGDGTVVFPAFGSTSHTYSQPGIYTVTMGGNINGINFSNSGIKDKILSVEAWGDNQWQSMQGTFSGCSNLVINATDAPDLSQVSNMSNMFQNTASFNQSIEHWDVSNVENMTGLFNGATTFNQPLDNWDVSNVTNMYRMFENATSFNQPLSNWNVSSVEDMRSVFKGATSFNQPLNNWNVSNVITMYRMFENASSFNQPLSNWNVSSVEDMGSVFKGATSFNQPLDSWDVSNVTNMQSMFMDADSFNQNLSSWNFNPSVYLNTFLSNSNIDILNYDAFLYSMAQSGIQNRQIGVLGLRYCDETSRNFLINNLGWSFNGDSFFNACDLYSGNPFITTWEVTANDLNITIPTNGSGFNYGIDFGDGNVEDNLSGNASHTFGAPGVYTVKIAGDFPRIFFSISPDKHKILSVDQWGDIEWQSMRRAFFGCSNLIINATDAPDLSQVTDLSGMFNGASSLNQPINYWDVSNATNMEGMFENASLFNQPLDNWNISSVTNMDDMFKSAGSFNQGLTTWNFNSSVTLDGFLSYSGLDTNNYDALLAHFAGSGLTSKTLGADDLIYCEEDDRNQLVNTFGWTIIGDEQEETCIMSLAENQMERIVMYPVPANEVLYIKIPGGIEIAEIKLYNVQGQTVKLVKDSFQEISLTGLASGVYFLKFYARDKNHIKQFVKK